MIQPAIKDLLLVRALKAMDGFEKSIKQAESMIADELADMNAMFGEEAVNLLLAQRGLSAWLLALDKKTAKVTGIRAPAKKPQKSKRKKARAKKAHPSRVVQGTYMSLLRKVSDSERERMKKLAKESGREEAIKVMTTLIKKTLKK